MVTQSNVQIGFPATGWSGLGGAFGRDEIVLGPAEEPPTESSDRPASVLVVDDERYIVDFVGILLEEEGYAVVRAYDGQQAWELARRHRPDLVITDVMMPRMNGFELLRRLRESRELGQVPVILMSAVARPDGPSGAHFLPKPFDIDRMLDLVTTELAAD